MKKNKTKYDVCIIGGCGHVGLPLGIIFSNKGLNVSLYDTNSKSVDEINSGSMPFVEAGADKLLKKLINKNLHATTDMSVISNSKYIIVTIGTPIDEYLNPNFKLLEEVFSKFIPYLNDSQIIIIRSTVFPGSTEKLKDMLLSCGKKTKITFCPERIIQGKSLEELEKLPQIVSGFDDECVKKVSKLFSLITKDIVAIEPLEAELAKIFNNAWRYIQFATANQFFMLATAAGVDFYSICNAMKFKYDRAKEFPSAGFAAGPCLLKDTMQLSAYANNNFFLGHSAMLINEGMPNFILQVIKENYNLSEKRVGILGMAFKPNNDDKRDSLSYKLKKLIEFEAKEVFCSDIYIQDAGFLETNMLVNNTDLIIIATPHSEYYNLDLSGKNIIDIWNIFGKGVIQL